MKFRQFAPLLGFSLLAAGLWACPGSIDDSSLFADSGPKPTASDSGAKACNAETEIFAKKCVSCHSTAGKSNFANLDLQASGVYDRLKVQKSTGANCGSALVVDPNNVDNSLLLKKVSGTHGMCGNKMPLTGDSLTATEVACVKSWIVGGGK